MIDEARLSKALTYLATTDEVLAERQFDMGQAEDKAKAIRDTVFLHEEGSVADRSAKAGTASVFQDAQSAFRLSEREYRKVYNKRKTEDRLIEVWRTFQANRRQGNI